MIQTMENTTTHRITVTDMDKIIDTYKKSLTDMFGYVKGVHEEKIDLYGAKEILAELQQKNDFSSDTIEERLFLVADKMGVEHSLINQYTRKNNDLDTVYVSCLLDALELTVNNYARQIDRII